MTLKTAWLSINTLISLHKYRSHKEPCLIYPVPQNHCHCFIAIPVLWVAAGTEESPIYLMRACLVCIKHEI